MEKLAMPTKSKTTVYRLELYEPDTEDACYGSFQQKTPYPRISQGDFLTYLSNDINTPDKYVKVTRVEHSIRELEGDNKRLFSFQTMIFTTEKKD
jgi:hypothetical protein